MKKTKTAGSRMIPLGIGLIILSILFLSGCAFDRQAILDRTLVQIKQETGLEPVNVPNTERFYLGGTHRGYPVLYTIQAGDVWGRFGARLVLGEAGREAGGVLAYLTGGEEYGPGIAGSPLDRVLAHALGQPISLVMILQHEKPNAPRLDLVSKHTIITPFDILPSFGDIGWEMGEAYAADAYFASLIAHNIDLVGRIADMRNQYIRVDDQAVTFFWAGQEKEYTEMLTECGGYSEMLNSIMDELADIADTIPEERETGGK